MPRRAARAAAPRWSIPPQRQLRRAPRLAGAPAQRVAPAGPRARPRQRPARSYSRRSTTVEACRAARRRRARGRRRRGSRRDLGERARVGPAGEVGARLQHRAVERERARRSGARHAQPERSVAARRAGSGRRGLGEQQRERARAAAPAARARVARRARAARAARPRARRTRPPRACRRAALELVQPLRRQRRLSGRSRARRRCRSGTRATPPAATHARKRSASSLLTAPRSSCAHPSHHPLDAGEVASVRARPRSRRPCSSSPTRSGLPGADLERDERDALARGELRDQARDRVEPVGAAVERAGAARGATISGASVAIARARRRTAGWRAIASKLVGQRRRAGRRAASARRGRAARALARASASASRADVASRVTSQVGPLVLERERDRAAAGAAVEHARAAARSVERAARRAARSRAAARARGGRRAARGGESARVPTM